MRSGRQDAAHAIRPYLDRALSGLPIIKEMGATVKTEALPIYEYTTFAADLKQAVAG